MISIKPKFLITSCGLVLLIGCSKVDTATWSEEVLLANGEVLVLQRQARANAHGFPNASRGGDIDYSVRVEGSNILWQGPGLIKPVAYDVIEGRHYLVLFHPDGRFCKSASPNEFSASFLEWVDGRWVSRAQADVPLNRMRRNLYAHYWGHSTKTDARGLVTIVEKSAKDAESLTLALPEFFKVGMRSCDSLYKLRRSSVAI